MKIYLLVNAVFYGLLALWCTVQHGKTSAASGYTALNNSGHSEYLVVYGGLQWGLTAIFAYLAMQPEYQRLGVLLAIFLYAPIVVYRVITVLKFNPVSAVTLGTGALEVGLLIAAVGLWFAKRG